MRIAYRCGCMEADREIEVTDRVPGSDIIDWFNGVIQPCLTYDHHARNPTCMRTTIDQVKIPVDGNEIGVAPVRN